MIRLAGEDRITDCATACALGLFDGVHRGHGRIIGKAVEKAAQNGWAAAVFCFRTDTVTSKGHDERIEMLVTDEIKAEKIQALGIDYLYSPEFKEMKNMPPEYFVRDVLKGAMNCSYAVCGPDFTFGRGAVGKADDLVRLGKKYGIETEVASQLMYNGRPISSTDIRSLIRQGDVGTAAQMLGYDFGYRLEVEHGTETGRKWDFPTVNQRIPKGLVLPRFGVYCSAVDIGGRLYGGVTNIGIKPTVQVNTAPLAETYILGYEGDLYGKTLGLSLLKFVRPERRFQSVEELRAEIAKNTRFAEEYFKLNKLDKFFRKERYNE